MSEWISVKERQPEQYADVLCSDGENVWFSEYSGEPNSSNPSGFNLIHGIGVGSVEFYHYKTITHWMPKPPPPFELES